MVKDNNGRVVWSLVEINTTMLLIIRVYAPAQGDDSNFFKDDVFPILGKVDYDHVVIGGDWNLGIAEDLDYWDYSCTDPVRPKSGRQIHKYIEHYELLLRNSASSFHRLSSSIFNVRCCCLSRIRDTSSHLHYMMLCLL